MSAESPSELARQRLAERQRRTRVIRRGVGAATLATFALAWGVIAHDGSMGTTTTASAATAGGASSTTTDQEPSSSSTAASDAPVTTAQS